MCVSDNRDVFRQVCLCWVKLGVTDVCDEFLLQSDVWYVHIKTKAVFRRRARVKEAQLESAHRIFSSTHLTKMETGSPLPSQAVQICRAVGRCYCICKSFEQSSGKFHVIFFFFFYSTLLITRGQSRQDHGSVAVSVFTFHFHLTDTIIQSDFQVKHDTIQACSRGLKAFLSGWLRL